MVTKKVIKTAGLSDTIDAQENLQSQLDAFKETFLKECKQLEMSNVDLLNRMSEIELLVDEHKAIIQRIKDRMGL